MYEKYLLLASKLNHNYVRMYVRTCTNVHAQDRKTKGSTKQMKNNSTGEPLYHWARKKDPHYRGVLIQRLVCTQVYSETVLGNLIKYSRVSWPIDFL